MAGLDSPSAADGIAGLDMPQSADGIAGLDLPQSADGFAGLDLPPSADGIAGLELPQSADDIAGLDLPPSADGIAGLDLPQSADGIAGLDFPPVPMGLLVLLDYPQSVLQGRVLTCVTLSRKNTHNHHHPLFSPLFLSSGRHRNRNTPNFGDFYSIFLTAGVSSSATCGHYVHHK